MEGRELRPLLHHHFAQFKPCDVFLPSPCRPSGYQHLPSPSDQEHRLGCLGIKAPWHKRSVFIFKAGRCPLRICPLQGSTCDCTPCPEPKRDRCQPLAGDVSKYERGTKSQVPRPPLLWKTQPGLSRLPGRRGLGAGRIRRQPAETAISPRNITWTSPWPSSLVRARKRITLHPESLINCLKPLAAGTGKPLLAQMHMD